MKKLKTLIKWPAPGIAPIMIGGAIALSSFFFTGCEPKNSADSTAEIIRIDEKFLSIAGKEDFVHFPQPFNAPPKVVIGIPSEDEGVHAFLNGLAAKESTSVIEVTKTGFRWKNTGSSTYNLRWIATEVIDNDKS